MITFIPSYRELGRSGDCLSDEGCCLLFVCFFHTFSVFFILPPAEGAEA